MQLAKTAQFPVDKIFTIDGSKRSSHSNAFFTGIGKFRHIVLYDTLIEQLSEDELAAVLAHEIGHYKRHHIRTSLIIEAALLLIGLIIIYYLSNASWFLSSFGFSTTHTFVPLVLIFTTAIEGITFWIEPIMNLLSRKHEYEADRFAREIMGTPELLISSLQKLHIKNLSNLSPHPLFSAFYYSHPTLSERINALRNL